MARYPVQIDVSELGMGRRVGLPERADFISVYNPTAYTLLAGWGSQRIPVGPADADFPFPPAAFTVLPVTSAEFGLVLAQPQLVTQPPGMPTRASVVFYARETPPLLSSIPLTGLVTSSPTTLFTSPNRAAGSYFDTFAVPDGVTELWVEQGPSGLLANFSVILLNGTTSNQQALLAQPTLDIAAGLSLQPYVGPWLPNLDTQCTVFSTTALPNVSFRIHGVYGAPSYTRSFDGAEVVTLSKYSRVALVDSVAGLITSANPLPVRSTFDRTPRTLLAATAFVGAGTVYHGPYDMQGAVGGTFVVYQTVGLNTLVWNVSNDGSFSLIQPLNVTAPVAPGYSSGTIGPGISGPDASAAQRRSADALASIAYVVVTRTANTTYSIVFYPLMEA